MSNTMVQTSYGIVQGVQEGTISIWKGIPYAQPPLGPRRFRPPQSPEAWTGVLQTTQFGPMAMQPPSMPAELLRRLSMSEDWIGDAPERAQLAQQMQRAWVAFAYHGDPNTPELPIWPRYDLEQRATMLFDQESTLQNDPNASARQIWANAVPSISQHIHNRR